MPRAGDPTAARAGDRAARALSDQFRAELARLARGGRRRLLPRPVVAGLICGFAAGLAYSLARPFLPVDGLFVSPLAVTGMAAALGGLAGLLFGLFSRVDERKLLIQADRALGTRELAGTAFDLVLGSRRSAFAEAIVSDAVEALRKARPRAILGRSRPRLLPLLPVVVAAALSAALLPFSLGDLFSRPALSARQLVLLGEELGETSRKLREASQGTDLRGNLELSLELERLGRQLKDHQVPPDELSERLALLERELAAEYAARLRRMRQAQSPQGSFGGEPLGSQPSQTQGEQNPPGADGQAADQSTEAQGSSGVEPSSASGLQELANTLNRVREMRRQAAPETARGNGSGESDGKAAESPTAEGTEGEAGASAEGRNPTDPERKYTTGEPGTTPEQDQPGPGQEIKRSEAATPLKAEVEVGEGSMARMLVRALPESGRVKATEDSTLREYQRQAESALSSEQVPYELRGYVREYFLSVGVMGER